MRTTLRYKNPYPKTTDLYTEFMNNQREQIISSVTSDIHNEGCSRETVDNIVATYADDVFNIKQMKNLLKEDTYLKLIKTIRDGAVMDQSIANDVASAMKNWAISKGATHFTHWFQPLTGTTAEKHDAFFEPDDDDHFIAKFSGKNLIIGESDASSFPSGGLRSTFEARGYTAWDPTSPAFIRRSANGATLCIPTAFCSYNCEALDKKTPLLRSIQYLKRAVTRLMEAFDAEKPDAHVKISLGAEQEYFLIDRKFYLARPDLIQTGRTLFGAPPPKHQQLDDHYFGSIHPRILAFMIDVEKRLWRLGIPAKTRHNEVAPAQFELAPIFEDINLAVDHNMLIMEILRTTAEEHGLVCLLHEKPFDGINGSGKHNNWSITYGDTNLLNPGKNPHQNAIFLTVLCAIIRAVDLHSDLLRAATATHANDLRLGANEAPPSVISIFLGSQLEDILSRIEEGITGENDSTKRSVLKIGVDTLPPFPLDAADRNRTSPFAFTNNKFEFRAPGSSQSCAGICTVLNTIAADSINRIAEEIEGFKNTEHFTEKLNKVLAKIYHSHKRVVFNGNGYDKEWYEEAKRRQLPNAANTPEALQALHNEDNIAFFEKTGVLSRAELLSRYEIFMNEYRNHVRIEGSLLLLMARTYIEPAAVRHLNMLLPIASASNQPRFATSAYDTITELLEQMHDECNHLESLLEKSDMELTICSSIKDLRKVSDSLERLVADDLWPLPKYREILFIS